MAERAYITLQSSERNRFHTPTCTEPRQPTGDGGKIAYTGSLDINVPDVALIFEGGGMRCSYTAGVVVTLIQQGINFGKVYGISAGSSHAVNYLSKDVVRARSSFTDLAKDPQFGGWGDFLRGKGYFNSPYLYEELIIQLNGTDEPMAFDADTFYANPADLHIEAFDSTVNRTVAWTKADMPDYRDIGLYVRASSTMPLFMPPVVINGHFYVDGGMGDSWGILLHAAQRDGFKRFFVVRTQEHDYRKKPDSPAMQMLLKSLSRPNPEIAQRTIDRWMYYNELLDEIDRLEQDGSAFVFCPQHVRLSNKEKNYDKLEAAYQEGYAQFQAQFDAFEAWL